MPTKGTCVDYGICDTSGQNDVRESETKQCTKAEAMSTRGDPATEWRISTLLKHPASLRR